MQDQQINSVPAGMIEVGPWAIASDYLVSALGASTRGTSFVSGIPSKQVGDIAMIHLQGPMSRGGGFFGGTATSAVVESLKNAAANPSVKGIALKINSPGGQVAGTKELGDTIKEVAKSKPVYATIEDVGASAAYWAASQATRVFAAEDSVVGSIGVMQVVPDTSKAADAAGVAVHVIRSDQTSDFKGTGVPGAPVSDAQLAEIKRHLTAKNDFFLNAVADGRGLNKTQLQQVADGRLFTANEAVDLGLVDEVATTEQVMGFLQAATSASVQKAGGSAMAQEIATTPESTSVLSVAEQVKAFRAACPGANDSQVLEWVSGSASIQDAQSAHIRKLEEENASLRQQIEAKPQQQSQPQGQAQAEAPAPVVQAKPVVIGLQPIGNGEEAINTDSSATAQWYREIERLKKAGMDQRAAVLHLMQSNKQLQQEYLAERNQS